MHGAACATYRSVPSGRQLQPRPISGVQRADHRGGCQQRGDRVPGDMCSRVGAGSKAGSGVAVHAEPTAMGVVRWPHKIQPGNAVARGSAREDGSNHLAMIANHELMMGAESSDGLGSSVHKFVRGKGSFLHSNLVGSLKQPKNDATRNYFLAKEGEKATVGLQGIMGNASSMKTIAESFLSFLDSSNTAMPTFSISLMESSPNIPAQPTWDEIIAFGGIPKASNGVRSDARLENRPDVDMPQMEKAMRNAQMRDTSCSSGYSYGGTLGSALGSPFAGGTAKCHGLWMHTAPMIAQDILCQTGWRHTRRLC
nr:uncharacterized protein LOC127336161 isoform X2 [Lolium perenne]